jgi:hypothetical protein
MTRILSRQAIVGQQLRDLVDVVLHGSRAHAQMSADDLVAPPARDRFCDLFLCGRESSKGLYCGAGQAVTSLAIGRKHSTREAQVFRIV